MGQGKNTKAAIITPEVSLEFTQHLDLAVTAFQQVISSPPNIQEWKYLPPFDHDCTRLAKNSTKLLI